MFDRRVSGGALIGVEEEEQGAEHILEAGGGGSCAAGLTALVLIFPSNLTCCFLSVRKLVKAGLR